MRISSQINGPLAGVVSVGFSLAVLLLLVMSWPVQKLPEKIPERVIKQSKPRPVVLLKPGTVSLPTPPQIKVAKKTPTETQLPQIMALRAKPVAKNNQPTKISRNMGEIPQAVEKGRRLLRLLEHGTGPSVEFAWPHNASARASLYHLLVQCHGMRVAVLDVENRLFTKDSTPGEKWQINLDRYSMFVRQISGRSEAPEQREISRIQKRHPSLISARPVRIFTRRMDAYVLGRLGQILGPGYRSKSTIRARYRILDKTIFVTNIVADDVSKPGQIRLPCFSRLGT